MLIKNNQDYIGKGYPTLKLSDIEVSINGNTVDASDKYLIAPNDDFSVTATIDGGDLINIPMIKIVAQECADDKPNGIEVYLTGTVKNGVISFYGVFPKSSNYKISSSRNNRALDRLGAGFNLSFTTIDLLT